MDVKALKQITSELSLLYVEDDDSLRDETARLFKHLFQSVDTAENGEMALEKLHQREYDLMVTDINMPVMNGVELCKSIRKKYAYELPILITSAHDESHYLLELIDIGINKFILKPLDITKVTSTLSQVCSHIYNKKLLCKYKQELEHSNIQLKQSNDELESLVKVLDKKIEQFGIVSQRERLATSSPGAPDLCGPSQTHQAEEPRMTKNEEGRFLFKEYCHPQDLHRLNTLHAEINAVTTLMNLKKEIEDDGIIHLAKLFKAYGNVLCDYPVFSHLGKKTIELSQVLEENTRSFLDHFNDISILLESFVYVLQRWKRALFVDGVKRPEMYDASLINDIDSIVIVLRQECSSRHEA